MRAESPAHPSPESPLDRYVRQVLDLVARNGDIPISTLADVCGREFNWLPGFCDVVLSVLRTNGLIVVYEWEPGKIHVTSKGQRWLAANNTASIVSG
jgi:hypothetical protein